MSCIAAFFFLSSAVQLFSLAQAHDVGLGKKFYITCGGPSIGRYIRDKEEWITGSTSVFLGDPTFPVSAPKRKNTDSFRSHRWSTETWSYSIPVANPGLYKCYLQFAETNPVFFGRRKRVFRVVVQGREKKLIDAFSQAPRSYNSISRNFRRLEIDDKLNIELIPIRGGAFISAITCLYETISTLTPSPSQSTIHPLCPSPTLSPLSSAVSSATPSAAPTSSISSSRPSPLSTPSPSQSSIPSISQSPISSPLSSTVPSTTPSASPASSLSSPSPSSSPTHIPSHSLMPSMTHSPTLSPPSPKSSPSSATTSSPTPSTSVVPYISLESHSESTFNAAAPLLFRVFGTAFDLDVDGVTLKINNDTVPASSITLNSTVLVADTTLIPGSNEISLKSFSTGKASVLSISATIWIGTKELTVILEDGNGKNFLQETTVTVILADSLSVRVEKVTSTGEAVFKNVPDRTVIVEATSIDNDAGNAGGVGSEGTITINMAGFGLPSSIDNNNFTSGTAGWDIPFTPSVSLINHVEKVGPINASSRIVRQGLVNKDLKLVTVGEGRREVTRTFKAKHGTTGVRVRYRFVTSEVPGGYFGSQYNDFFSVSIRSKIARGSISESGTMNGLGLAAFDSDGSTSWRQTILPVNGDIDVIEVQIAVGNVADGAFDSFVVVDFVEEINCYLGEKPKVVITIGPVDALKAKNLADEAFAAADATGLPGGKNDARDAFRHCFWSCRMAQEIGAGQAKEVGDLHETCGSNSAAEIAMDLHNNDVGRGYGTPKADCNKLCLAGIKNGDLQVSL